MSARYDRSQRANPATICQTRCQPVPCYTVLHCILFYKRPIVVLAKGSAAAIYTMQGSRVNCRRAIDNSIVNSRGKLHYTFNCPIARSRTRMPDKSLRKYVRSAPRPSHFTCAAQSQALIRGCIQGDTQADISTIMLTRPLMRAK